MKTRGATFNGSTNSDRTNYYETLPASDENLAFAINLEADRLVNSHVKAEDLKTEFSVVRNEFESGENSPQRVLNQRMMAVAYEWHNYGKSTIGNRSDIERVPIHNLQAFYRKFYQPDNVVRRRRRQVRREEGAGPRREVVRRDPEARPQARPDLHRGAAAGRRARRSRCDASATCRRSASPTTSRRWRTPTSPPSRCWRASSRPSPRAACTRRWSQPKKATSAGPSRRDSTTRACWRSSAEVPKGGSIAEVRDGIFDVIEAVKEKGVTKEEVERVRQQFLKARELASSDVNQLAVRLSEPIAQGDWRLYFLARDRIEQVTPEQVQAVAEEVPHAQQPHRRRVHPERHARSGRRCRTAPDLAEPGRRLQGARRQLVGRELRRRRRWRSRSGSRGPRRSGA